MRTKQLKKPIIAPSVLSIDFNNVDKELRVLNKSRIKWLHYDVMDGHFVDNISFGIPVFVSINAKHSNLVSDVHIMVSDPLKWGEVFAKKGASYVTFHYEACADANAIRRVINVIHRNGAKVGISIKPNTDVKVLDPFLEEIDLVLIMSVEPGFGGQGFIADSLEKVRYLRNCIDNNNYDLLIEIDGGINSETALLARNAGVDVLVAGSYLFGHDDISERINLLRNS